MSNRSESPGSSWCCRVGLNHRPRPYQGRALPLSYGSALLRRPEPIQRLAGACKDRTPTLTSLGAVTKLATAMTKIKSSPGLGKAGAGAREARKDRLAAALRENLRKRKAQARERAAPEEPASPESKQS